MDIADATNIALQRTEAAFGPKPNSAQITRLYAIASNNGWTHEGVLELIKMNYRRTSSKELTMPEYNEICDFLQKSNAPNVVSMREDTNTISFLN